LVEVISDYRIESVIHFAASAMLVNRWSNRAGITETTSANTMNLLDAMLETGVLDIVFPPVGDLWGAPFDSDRGTASAGTAEPYGESKHVVERMLKSYGTAYGLRWVALRYFNAAGADMSGEIGEVHDPETHLIPLALQAAAGQRRALEIFGTDYATPDGTAIRDYIHVADLADAHVSAADYLRARNPSIAINLGNGAGYSVREVVETVQAVTAREVPVILSQRRPGDAPALVANADRAHTILGWRPQVPALDSIVSSAWSWYSAKGQALSRSGEARVPVLQSL